MHIKRKLEGTVADRLSIFEMKWNPAKASVRFPQSFMEAYSPKQAVVVIPENYLEFLI